MNVQMIYVDSSIDEDHVEKLREAAKDCNAKFQIQENVELELSNIIKEKRSSILQYQQSKTDHQKTFKFLLVFHFAERTLATSLKHDQIFDIHATHFFFLKQTD